MTEFKASNIVQVCPLLGTVNLVSLAYILPVVKIETQDGNTPTITVGGRTKIPYFGADTVIVSVRYKGHNRGIRTDGKPLISVVGVDLQCCEKNIHVNISQQKLHITGALSEEMGKTACHLITQHINMAQSHIDHIMNLNSETRQKTLDWILEVTRGDEIERTIMQVQETEEGTEPTGQIQRFKDYTLRMNLRSILQSLPSGVDSRMSTFLLVHVTDAKFYSEYIVRLQEILNSGNIIMEISTGMKSSLAPYQPGMKLECGVAKVHNGVYNYSLGRSVRLISLCKFLYSKNLDVAFHNWNNKDVRLAIPILEELSPISLGELELNDEEATDRIPAHRFTIHQKGSIRQTSPSSFAKAHEVYLQVMEILEEYFDESEEISPVEEFVLPLLPESPVPVQVF